MRSVLTSPASACLTSPSYALTVRRGARKVMPDSQRLPTIQREIIVEVRRLTLRGVAGVRGRGVLGLGVALLVGLGSACSSPQRVGTPKSSTSESSTTSPSKKVARSPSPPLVAGTPVPGYRVDSLSFVSPSRGYGLVEFDTTGLSTNQQLVVTENGGVTWQTATSTPLPAWASTLEFTDSEDGMVVSTGRCHSPSTMATRLCRPSARTSGLSRHLMCWRPLSTAEAPG